MSVQAISKETFIPKCGQCHTILDTDQKMAECSICKKVYYCNDTCKQTNEPLHKKICQNAKIKCDSCGKIAEVMHRCSRCKKGFYCSTKCQTVEWPKHKNMCRTGFFEKKNVPPGEELRKKE